MNKYLIFILALIFLSSCEKEMKIQLPDAEEKIVVEGSIENNAPPFVQLSKTVGFFSKIDTSVFMGAFISGAKVTVSTDDKSIVLKEYSVGNGDFKVIFYTIDTTDFAALSFIGEVGKTYHLSIWVDGKEYTSSTSIPELNYGLDSFWVEMPSDRALEEDSTFRLVKGKYKNPNGQKNKLRLSNAINGGNFYYPYFSVYDDELVSDAPASIDIMPGWNKFDTLDFTSFRYFRLNDTIDIRVSAIDDITYEFYKTLEYSYGTVGNPFAAPMIVSSNIEGGALGVWAGFASVVSRFIVEDEE